MEKRYLLSVDDLKANGFIHGNVETESLNAIIMRVQARIIMRILGSELYTKILDLIEAYNNGAGTDIPAPYKNLYENFIVPCIIPYIEKRSTTFITWRTRNAGVGKFNDQYFTSSSKQETTNLVQEIEEDITHFHNELVNHLIENGVTVYPEYKCQTAVDKHSPETRKKLPLGNMMFIKNNGRSKRC